MPYRNLAVQFDSSSKKGEACARSETALYVHNDIQHWHESRRSHSLDEADNNSVTKDGSTTITSALSQRESEEVLALREERNSYRDMCLTLGAEVAKLKNLLAVSRGPSAVVQGSGFSPPQPFQAGFSLDPESVSSAFPRARTLAAMSDAGYRGDHESLASEEDTCARMKADVRNSSSVATLAGSDASVDPTNYQIAIQLPGCIPVTRELHDPVSLNGMQSRLALEIHRTFIHVFAHDLHPPLTSLFPCLHRIC
jgi:hypothetical protein